jgi:hypothetical protein
MHSVSNFVFLDCFSSQGLPLKMLLENLLGIGPARRPQEHAYSLTI